MGRSARRCQLGTARIHAALARAVGNVRLVWRLANRIGDIAVLHGAMYCSRGAQ
jgi:hypothetical protein